MLLVDEVLAVGDAEFQVKCLARIRELKRRGVTTILISHDLTAVEQLCDTAVLLEKGLVTAAGAPSRVIADYHRRITSAETATGDFPPLAREGALKITGLTFADRDSARTGAPLTISLRYVTERRLDGLSFELTYYSNDGKTVLATVRAGEASDAISVLPPGGTFEFTSEALPLKPGAYYLGAVVREASNRQVVDWWDGGTMLFVEPGATVEGQFHMPHTWRVRQAGGGEGSVPRIALPAPDGAEPAAVPPSGIKQ